MKAPFPSPRKKRGVGAPEAREGGAHQSPSGSANPDEGQYEGDPGLEGKAAGSTSRLANCPIMFVHCSALGEAPAGQTSTMVLAGSKHQPWGGAEAYGVCLGVGWTVGAWPGDPALRTPRDRGAGTSPPGHRSTAPSEGGFFRALWRYHEWSPAWSKEVMENRRRLGVIVTGPLAHNMCIGDKKKRGTGSAGGICIGRSEGLDI